MNKNSLFNKVFCCFFCKKKEEKNESIENIEIKEKSKREEVKITNTHIELDHTTSLKYQNKHDYDDDKDFDRAWN